MLERSKTGMPLPMSVSHGSDDRADRRFLTLLGLLWLTGAATRIPILSVPPLLPRIHDDLHLAETQVGLLVALPLILFAVASVPGSLLIARTGLVRTIVFGLTVTALASAARGATIDITTLYGATILMGFGIAVVQPALPQLVQQWMPSRIALGTAVYTNGVLVGTTATVTLTIPVVLPAVGQSWRHAIGLWSIPVVFAALMLLAFAPRPKGPLGAGTSVAAWWPDWRSPVVWQLAVAFAASNGIYFGVNAFLPDYLSALARPDLITWGLAGMNGGQLAASFVMLGAGQRLHRRVWPFPVFGSAALASLIAMMFASGPVVVLLSACLGLSTSITYVMLLVLPAVLSAPQDVHRTAAGMFTISFAFGVLVPTVSGAAWDLSGAPWAAFVPLAVCALVLIAGGTRLTFLKPHDS
jgi:MFS transporter, CP family, cyanate transporter